MEPVTKSVVLPGDIKLEYVEQGDSSGTPVVLLHGGLDSWHSFEPVLPYLPESLHVFALTQRGHGDSSRPEKGYRYQAFAADVAAFLDALELKAVFVAGHSMGSSVAQRFAINYPERLLGLALVGTSATFRNNPVLEELWDSEVSKLTDPVGIDFVREFQASTLARPVPEAFFRTVVDESLKVPAHVWRATFSCLLEDDFSHELGNVKAPTLIVWGDQDALCLRSDQEAVLAAMAHSRLIVYEGAGHAAHWEEPARFAADLVRFVETYARRGNEAASQ